MVIAYVYTCATCQRKWYLTDYARMSMVCGQKWKCYPCEVKE